MVPSSITRRIGKPLHTGSAVAVINTARRGVSFSVSLRGRDDGGTLRAPVSSFERAASPDSAA
jgi:hypothetical protein